MKRRK